MKYIKYLEAFRKHKFTPDAYQKYVSDDVINDFSDMFLSLEDNNFKVDISHTHRNSFEIRIHKMISSTHIEKFRYSEVSDNIDMAHKRYNITQISPNGGTKHKEYYTIEQFKNTDLVINDEKLIDSLEMWVKL